MANTLPLLSASVVDKDELDTIKRLAGQITNNLPGLIRLDRYHDGQQRLEHIGLAVPPELRHFETVVNVPRMAVSIPEGRQNLRAFYRRGDSTKVDTALQEAWEYNNLPSESSMMQTDEKIYGRSFVAVGSNPEDRDHPLITVESPLQMGFEVNIQQRRFLHLFRMYSDPTTLKTHGTLYTPDRTVPYIFDAGGWQINGTPDEHKLGRVPVVMFLNRRRAGYWFGQSEMVDAIGKTDAIARMVTNMQIGAEGHALPSWFLSGVSAKDFVDRDGNPVPVWESYITKIKALTNENARVQQFQAGDLSNFTEAVNAMLKWCSAELGLPIRYFGQETSNPASEGAIGAEETRLRTNVERMNKHDGDSWAWVMGLEEKFRTGDWGDRNSIRAVYFDPGTPTISQVADAAMKMRAEGVLSVEGVWDMLGWDEARKLQERDRLAAEAANDPLLNATRALTEPSAVPTGA